MTKNTHACLNIIEKKPFFHQRVNRSVLLHAYKTMLVAQMARASYLFPCARTAGAGRVIELKIFERNERNLSSFNFSESIMFVRFEQSLFCIRSTINLSRRASVRVPAAAGSSSMFVLALSTRILPLIGDVMAESRRPNRRVLDASAPLAANLVAEKDQGPLD